MRRIQLFKTATQAAPNNLLAASSDETEIGLSVVAAEYVATAKRTIEPMIKDPTAALEVTEDLIMALFALKQAAELYEEVNAWHDALFAWSMLKAVPVPPEMQWGASEKIEQCQRHIQAQFVPHPPV